MITFLTAVGVGGLAAVVRYLVTRALVGSFPWAVLVVNVVGSAIGGVVLGLATVGGLGGDIRLILLGGFCGGLTTFSTFGVDTIQLVQDGAVTRAVLNVAANLVLGIGACGAAYAIVLIVA